MPLAGMTEREEKVIWNIKKCFIFLFISTVFFGFQIVEAGWEDVLKAHGGLDKWKSFQTLEYDIQGWPFGPKGALNDHQMVNLQTRQTRITSSDYEIVFDGKDVWAKPDLKVVGAPPRFYVSTPFYFLGIPFVLADPGVQMDDLGPDVVNKKSYWIYRFQFGEGIGDSHEDEYLVHVDTTTNRVAFVLYTVTYPGLMKEAEVEDLHVIHYDEWQMVQGLYLAKKVTFYEWKKGGFGQSHGSYSYQNIRMEKKPPSADIFTKPEGAVKDNSIEAGADSEN